MHNERRHNRGERSGVEIRPGDYGGRGVLEQSLRSADVVLLVSGMDDPEKRIEQHRNVIEAARSAGVRKIVYTSVQGAEDLNYTPTTVEEYRMVRVAELGEFIGSVITGISQGIRDGEADNPSNYNEAAGRAHVRWPAYFAELAEGQPWTD